MDEQTETALSVLEQLQDSGLLEWPIDVEVVPPDSEETSEALDSWFDNANWRGDGDRFLQIACDGSGSIYALWFYPDLEGDDLFPPVVFLGSEGEAFLVASSAEDFARQLASGETFHDGSWLKPEDDEDVDWTSIRELVEETLGDWEESAGELASRAADEHPDFSKWARGVLGEF